MPLTRWPAAELEPHPELTALAELARSGFALAPLQLVRAELEETFYRLNNLPTQLSALFAGLDLSDPDEDDLEERAPTAQRLLRAHYLLDETVDLFYAGLEGLPAQLRVRRLNVPGSSPQGRVASRGRPALLALKETWADDWTFDALWLRTQTEHSVALAATPLLLAPSGLEDAGDAEAGRASAALQRRVRLLQDPAFGVTGVRFL